MNELIQKLKERRNKLVLQNSHHLRIEGFDLAIDLVEQAAQPPAAEAVAFAEWVMNNQFKMYNGVWTSTKIHYSPNWYTTAELYQLFLTQTKGGTE